MKRDKIILLAALVLAFVIATVGDITDTDSYDWIKHDCDGATTGFTFEWRVNQSSDIVVLLYDTSDDTVETLTETTDYSISVTNNDYTNMSGGTVTTVETYDSTYDLIITTTFTLTQTATMTFRWNPSQVEAAIDKSRLIDRWLNMHRLRSVRAPEEDDPDLDMELPNAATRASGRLGFDTDGAVTIVTADVSGTSATSFGADLVDDANAAEGRNTLEIRENTFCLLSSTVVTLGTNGQALNQQTLYTVPSGYNGIVEFVVLREPSASLAGCTDVNFGIGAGTSGTWIDAEAGIADMTATDDYMVLERTDHISNEFSVIDGDNATEANRTFGVHVETGATSAAATCTIDVFGYIWE